MGLSHFQKVDPSSVEMCSLTDSFAGPRLLYYLRVSELVLRDESEWAPCLSKDKKMMEMLDALFGMK